MKKYRKLVTRAAVASCVVFTTLAQDNNRTTQTLEQKDTAGAQFNTSSTRTGRLGPSEKANKVIGMEVKNSQNEKLGKVDDLASIPVDLLRRPRVIVQPRAPFFDAYVASVEGVRHVTRADTVRLRVSYGTAGTRERGRGTGKATLVVSVGDRRLTTQAITLPDSGVLETSITLPASRFPLPGWQVLEVRLDDVSDAEPRDDARLFAIDVSLEPAAVIFASPPDWDARFLARTLSEVARVPVKVFVETEPGRWRDGATLAPVPTSALSSAAGGARLVVAMGDPERARAFTAASRNAVLLWPTNGQAGDWYVERPLSSPFTAALAGVLWDSLPPATAVALQARDSNPTATVALTARLA